MKDKKNSFYGKKHSKESRRRMSESHKGKRHSEETKKKISKNHVGMKGKEHSEEAKEKMSRSHEGKILSEEHKKNISESCRGTNHPMYGKKHSERTKLKIAITIAKVFEENHNNFRHTSKNYFTGIELIVKNFLEKHSIKYKHNMRVGYYFPDFIILDNVILECDGEYWHSENNKDYSEEREKKRDKYLEKKGYLVFHLTEENIRKRLKSLMATILRKVRKRNGTI